MPLALLGLLFALGLAVVDQGVRLFGDSLVASGAIADDPYRDVAHREPGATLLVGDCRAEVVDSSAVARKLATPVVNAGGAAVGMGHTLFAANVALSRPRGGALVLFVNDQVLAESAERIADEIDRQWRWSSHLSVDRRARLEALLPWQLRPFRASGLWRYRGAGLTLVRSAVRRAMGKPPVRSAVNVNRVYENATMAGREDQYTPAGEWAASPAALAALDSLIDDSRAAGIPVTLVLSPMHTRRNIDAVNRAVIAAATELARRHDVKLLSYLGNETEWAKRSEWWGNPGHLNGLGARTYSNALARDLAGGHE